MVDEEVAAPRWLSARSERAEIAAPPAGSSPGGPVEALFVPVGVSVVNSGSESDRQTLSGAS